MTTRYKSETVSRASSPSRCFSTDGNSDDEVAKPISFDMCGSIKDHTSSMHPLTQKRRIVPYAGVHRDKESLLEEFLSLQNAFQEQKFHCSAHKSHHDAVQAVHSKLESNIEYLEISGLEAARTGTVTKLTSKLKGCKARMMDLVTTCSANAAELRMLRAHPQVMKTQEATVQRELFALEVRRLQKCLLHLRNLYKKVLDDNKETLRLKEEIFTLTAKNQELETSVAGMSKTVKAMTTEVDEWKAKGVAAKTDHARDDKRFISLQDDSKSLMDLLFKEKLAKENFTTMINTVGQQVRLVERETREKETLDSAAANVNRL